MLLSEDKITEIYCLADDFCKFYSETVKNNALEEPGGKRHRNKPNRLSDAEVITILVAFHMGGHRVGQRRTEGHRATGAFKAPLVQQLHHQRRGRHRRILLLP